MKHRECSALIFFIKALLLVVVSSGFVLGFLCFSSVDIEEVTSLNSFDFLPCVIAIDITVLMLLPYFSSAVFIFLLLFFIFFKAFSLSYVIEFCILLELFCHGFFVLILINLFVLVFSLMKLDKLLYSFL